MNDVNQNSNQTQSSEEQKRLKELWEQIETANITSNDIQKATDKIKEQRLTNSQIEELRAEIKKQANSPADKP
ncbi:hypothetical protein M1523_02090 [Patescibacteria group bacterium]|nr:hypothetical protein [Patescibacteria group bacterium]MCL5092002.1 hypothetical protein [Patescibacteria group bacterium]